MKYYTIYQKVNCLLNTYFIACIRVVIITLKISIRAYSVNLLACLQDETSSFRLFKVARDGWQRMKYFPTNTSCICLSCCCKASLVLLFYFPLDSIIDIFVLKFPDVLTKFCGMFLNYIGQ